MPTKAELERQVKSLKLQLAQALAYGARGGQDPEGTTNHSAALMELQQQCNHTLNKQLSELQTELSELWAQLQSARCQALVVKQQTIVELERES